MGDDLTFIADCDLIHLEVRRTELAEVANLDDTARRARYAEVY